MSSDIYARPDLSKKARYTRKLEEGGGEWEEREVVIYQSVDDIRYDPTGFQAQEGETQSEKHPPVQKGAFRGPTLVLSGLCLLLFAGIIALIIYHISVTLEKDPLKTKVLELKTNNSQLQDEVKKLKDVIEGKCCPGGWKRFGCSCYFKSTQWKTWEESRRDCQSEGADLVMINSKEEQEFVTRLGNYEESWIGLEQTWTYRGWKWKWVDGSSLTVKFWAEGEPQSSNNYRVCYNYLGQWASTHYNSYTWKWICEKQIFCFH